VAPDPRGSRPRTVARGACAPRAGRLRSPGRGVDGHGGADRPGTILAGAAGGSLIPPPTDERGRTGKLSVMARPRHSRGRGPRDAGDTLWPSVSHPGAALPQRREGSLLSLLPLPARGPTRGRQRLLGGAGGGRRGRLSA